MYSFYEYILAYRLIDDGNIDNRWMVSFTINLELMSWVRTKQNEVFRGWYEFQRSDATEIKTNDWPIW